MSLEVYIDKRNKVVENKNSFLLKLCEIAGGNAGMTLFIRATTKKPYTNEKHLELNNIKPFNKVCYIRPNAGKNNNFHPIKNQDITSFTKLGNLDDPTNKISIDILDLCSESDFLSNFHKNLLIKEKGNFTYWKLPFLKIK